MFSHQCIFPCLENNTLFIFSSNSLILKKKRIKVVIQRGDSKHMVNQLSAIFATPLPCSFEFTSGISSTTLSAYTYVIVTTSNPFSHKKLNHAMIIILYILKLHFCLSVTIEWDIVSTKKANIINKISEAIELHFWN